MSTYLAVGQSRVAAIFNQKLNRSVMATHGSPMKRSTQLRIDSIDFGRFVEQVRHVLQTVLEQYANGRYTPHVSISIPKSVLPCTTINVCKLNAPSYVIGRPVQRRPVVIVTGIDIGTHQNQIMQNQGFRRL
jgi:hypothetical protein